MISKWLGRSKADISLQTHATLIRQKGPLPLQSTFRFEGAYSLFKKAYQDGTYNKGKQLMCNFYTGIVGRNCPCSWKLAFHTAEKGTTDDTRVYTHSAAYDEYRLFKITDVSQRSDGFLTGIEIATQTWQPLHGCPDFGTVGIFRMRGYKGDPIRISVADVKGKVCVVDNFAITLPKIILFEAN